MPEKISTPFKAVYNYGPKEQQLEEKPFLIKSITDIAVRIFKDYIIMGATDLKNLFIKPHKIAKNKQILYKMGGESVSLQTPDGDQLDGMYLSVKELKKILEKHLEPIEVTLNPKDWLSDPDDRFSDCEQKVKILTIKNFDPDSSATQETVKLLKTFGIFPITCNAKEGYFPLIDIPWNFSDPQREENTSPRPTALICPGAAGNYPNYKNLAMSYLLRGIDVMMFDYRGYGESEGIPTEDRLNLDVETAYQYLVSEKKIENKNLVVHGSCLGVGPASDLAARRPGVHLISDRSFCEYREAVRHNLPRIVGFVQGYFPRIGGAFQKHFNSLAEGIHSILPSIFNYNNGENLKKIKGDIAIFSGIHDTVIPQKEIDNLINSLPSDNPNQNLKIWAANVPHEGLWAYDPVSKAVFDDFLKQAGLLRRPFF